MARTRKSRLKTTAAQATGARETPSTGRKPARKPKSTKEPASDPLDDFIRSAARALALPLEPQWLPAIKANLDTNLRLAALVAEFALPDESEPAPVFTA